MDPSYRFTFDAEPSEEQLHTLMQAVLGDVQNKAFVADEKFKSLQQQQIKEALEKMQWKQINE
jgi:hypothetical protein